jgi:hypothetical protein
MALRSRPMMTWRLFSRGSGPLDRGATGADKQEVLQKLACI